MDKSDEKYGKEFENWVKCCIALRHLKAGLVRFVDNQVHLIHNSVIRGLQSRIKIELVHCNSCVTNVNGACKHDVKIECETCKGMHCADKIQHHQDECTWAQCKHCREKFCSQCCVSSHVVKPCNCTASTIQPIHDTRFCLHSIRSKCNCNGKRTALTRTCKNKLCGHLYDAALQIHAKQDPQFINSDPKLWRIDAWEFAKCFLSTPGYDGLKCPGALDAAALLSICINNQRIHSSIHNMNIFREVRQLRNKIFHSSTQMITNDEAILYIDAMVDVLEDVTCIRYVQSAREAVRELKKLQGGGVSVTFTEVKHARSDAVEALNLDESQTKAEINDLRNNGSKDCEQILVEKLIQLTTLYELEKQQRDEKDKIVEAVIKEQRSIALKVDTLEQQYKGILDYLDEIRAKDGDLNNIRPRATVTVRPVDGTASKENEDSVSTLLETEGKKYIEGKSDQNLNILHSDAKTFFKTIEKETGKIEEATKKCLELKIRCLTIAGFIQLLKNCAAGALTAQFQPVQDKLRGITENPQLEMEVVMYEENALSTFQQIADEITCHLKGYRQEFRQDTLNENSKKTNLVHSSPPNYCPESRPSAGSTKDIHVIQVAELENSSKPSRPPPLRASLSAPTVLQRPRVQSKLFLTDDTSKRWQEYRQKKGRFPIRTFDVWKRQPTNENLLELDDLSLRDVGLMLTASASLIKRMRKNEARLKQLEKEQRHAEFQSTVLMLRLNQLEALARAKGIDTGFSEDRSSEFTVVKPD